MHINPLPFPLASPFLPSLAAAAPGVLPTPASPEAPAGPGSAATLLAIDAGGTPPGESPVPPRPAEGGAGSSGDGAPSSRARRDAASTAPAGPRSAPPPSPNADLLAGLGRRFRGPTLRMSFELRTSIARQIFRRDFVYVSQQLHALEASRRVQGLPRDDLNEALAAIGRRIDAVRTLLLQSTLQTRELIALHGHADSDIEFARPTVLQATIVSPYARDFMDVLVHADTALGELERSWLLGLIEPIDKGRMAGECRKAVQSVKEMVRQQRQAIGAQVRELNARRPQGEAELDAQADRHPDDTPSMPTDGAPAGSEEAISKPPVRARAFRDASHADPFSPDEEDDDEDDAAPARPEGAGAQDA